MYFGIAKQMQNFAWSLQKTMVEHMQNTMKLQMDMLTAIQNPVDDRMQSITSSMQNIFREQMKMYSTGTHNPMSSQVEGFSASVQRIMSEQVQIFAASTANPTPEQMEEFFSAMQRTMAEQMQLAVDMQAILSEQMQQFIDNLRNTMTDLAGSNKESDKTES